MIFKQGDAPFIRREETVSSMMRDMITALLLLMVLPVVYTGFRVVTITLVTVLACVAGEVVFSLIAAREISTSDYSPIVTGMIIAMLMPVNAPLWLPVVAGLFAILVAKGPFGTTGNTPFNPAAAGVAFVTLCWPDKIFGYFDTAQKVSLPLFADCSVKLAKSSAAVLKDGLKPDLFPFQMLWNQMAGPIGTTAALVIAACGLYIFLKRAASWQITVCFLGAAAAYAALFPRIQCSALTSVKYELLSGSLLFCAVFMITEPSTSPRTLSGRCIYGILGGILLMLFRQFGAYEQGACFVILIMNVLSPCIDHAICDLKMRGAKLLEERAARKRTA